MDERVMQFRVGVFFLAALLCMAIVLVLFGKLPSLVGRTYEIQIELRDADGVSKETPVRKSGILIGRVGDVELIDRDAKVLVTARIQAEKYIYQNEECFVTRNLLSGDTALTFSVVPGKPGAGKRIESGTLLHGHVSDNLGGLRQELEKPIDTIMDTGKSLKEASEQLGAAARRVEDILNVDTQKDVQSVLKDAAVSLAAIRNILGSEDNRQKLTEAMQRLPDTIDNMNATFRSTDEAVRAFTQRPAPGEKTAVERLIATINMTERALHKFTEPTEPGKPAPSDQIANAMNDMAEVAGLVRSVVARLDEGEGSLGALLKDRQLYDRLNRTARNLEETSQKLKPIVDDARVITDKIARHPGVVIRDAVKPGPGIK